jgi:hypothetical protein
MLGMMFNCLFLFSRKNPFSLLVALNSNSSVPAHGTLFWDDGETPGM